MTSDKFIKLEKFDIRVPDQTILHRLGYKRGAVPAQGQISQMIEEERDRMNKLIKPVSFYRIMDYDETNQHQVFANAVKVAFCICTIGPDLEAAGSAFIEANDMLRGFMLDSFGSEAAEEVAQQSDGIIALHARELGLWPSKRYSPGYGSWDIREQKYVFSLLPTESLGVKLSESFMMIPRKSVSFRINLYRDREQTTRTKF
jgi:cobalamin-dependent methionine synthase I